MGKILMARPPELRQLEKIIDDLISLRDPQLIKEDLDIIPILTQSPILQALSLSLSKKTYLLFTARTIASLTTGELYFLVGHELGHSRSTRRSKQISIAEEIEADLKGFHALVYYLGGKRRVPEALRIANRLLEKIGALDQTSFPCFRRHDGYWQNRLIDNITARKEALQQLAFQIEEGKYTSPLLEGINIHEIGLDPGFNYLTVKFSVTQAFINDQDTYENIIRLFKLRDHHWRLMASYNEKRPLLSQYTVFRLPLEGISLKPGKYHLLVKLTIYDAAEQDLGSGQAQAYFEVE